MPDIDELREPDTSCFIQRDLRTPDTDFIIGKQFLEYMFYDQEDIDQHNEKERMKNEYSTALLEFVHGTEIPFNTIHVTSEVLDIAVTAIGHGNNNREAADTCLETVRDSVYFEIHYINESRYLESVDDFLGFNPRKISISEAIMADVAEDEDIEHVVTWDSDFTRYDFLSLYPRNFWD